MQPLAAALPVAKDKMHVAVGAMAIGSGRYPALARRRAKTASWSSSAALARTRRWAARELALRLTGRFRRMKAVRLAEAAAKAAAAQAAEATEEEPEVGLRLSRSTMFMTLLQ